MVSLCQEVGENYALMDFIQFCEEVRRLVERQLGEAYEITLKKIVKNNQKEFQSIMIKDDGASVAPTIYLEAMYDAYENGAKITAIAEDVVRIYEENRNPWPEGIDFTLAGVRDKIVFRVINYDRNKELLEHMPYICFGELAVCFECMLLEARESVGSVRIENRMLSEWNIGLSDLIELAKENTYRLMPVRIEPIEDVLVEILMTRLQEDCSLTDSERDEKTKEILDQVLDSRERGGLPMYVLSNARNHFGANAMLNIDFMDEVRGRLKEDFYILPSSIHELIVIPVSFAPTEDRLMEMVKEVNEREVPDTEYLSDSVFRYGFLRRQISTALQWEA